MIIIIPDLHGDFIQFCQILIYFKIIQSANAYVILNYLKLSPKMFISKFNLKNKRIIQLGDILDSKNRNKGMEIEYSDIYLFVYLVKLKQYFPDNIELILGNHEFMNCHGLFQYVNKYSTRTEQEINFIRKSIIEYFRLFYIDQYKNLYIHAAIPKNMTLKDANKIIFNNIKNVTSIEDPPKTTPEFIKIYESIFTREIPSIEHLNKLNIDNIFLGHTPSDEIKIINERIFYLDNFISFCFESVRKSFSILSIENKMIMLNVINKKMK